MKRWAWCFGRHVPHLASWAVVSQGLREIIAQVAGGCCGALRGNNGEGVALAAAEGQQRGVVLHIQPRRIVSECQKMSQQNSLEIKRKGFLRVHAVARSRFAVEDWPVQRLLNVAVLGGDEVADYGHVE
jgi:hypothetical protein